MLLPLRYVGRRTHRSDGEARRVVILEATLRLIVKEGIRGVRHRAVAQEANVPLASTTYYFKDIKDLISDALTYFAEKTLWMNNTLEQKSFQLLQTLKLAGDQVSRKALADNLSLFICEHIKEQVSHRDDRILEVAFHEEALRNPQLASAIQALDNALLNTIEQFFVQLGSSQAMAEAHQVLGLIRWVEYQTVVSGKLDESQLNEIITVCINNIFATQ